ncbi:aminotransferase class III-fold pyridoxal phosphate-dependent enzyme, partial [Candidatus Woesearchaeota archaeon]|nr:aminotransferase class III-fold pyridoxal phosphate-dependent enzyme [Candidatus Woesearchaeota archaeon]
MRKNSYKKSIELWEKSKKFVVPGSSIIAKDPRLYTYGAYPIFLTEGNGAIVKDIDGNEFIDFQGSLGANILGTAYPKVNQAIKKQLSKGTLFSLSTPLQVELAKQICSMVPCAERVRILKNGSDATTGAIRIARAFTGKRKIASCHFHGWQDWSYVLESMNRGIPEDLKRDIITFKYNDIGSLKKIFKDHKNEIAAVIMEPINFEKPVAGFLDEVKILTAKNGTVLIFDEVVTGFRFSQGGAQEYFKVIPDLCCLAKALGNGTPISAIVGKKEILDKTVDVITSMTYGDEAISMAASLATLKE